MLVAEDEIALVKDFVSSLNDQVGSAVAVEGMRDARALRRLGFTGSLLQFHRFGGMARFADEAAKYESVIILFDWDRGGRRLTSKAIRLLERRTRVNTSFRGRMYRITKGKAACTEQLTQYERYVS